MRHIIHPEVSRMSFTVSKMTGSIVLYSLHNKTPVQPFLTCVLLLTDKQDFHTKI